MGSGNPRTSVACISKLTIEMSLSSSIPDVHMPRTAPGEGQSHCGDAGDHTLSEQLHGSYMRAPPLQTLVQNRQ